MGTSALPHHGPESRPFAGEWTDSDSTDTLAARGAAAQHMSVWSVQIQSNRVGVNRDHQV